MVAPLLMGLATYSFTEAPPPVYEAEALVKITKTATVAGLMTDVLSFGAYDAMKTQITIVTSQPVLEKVARRLNLAKPGESERSVIGRLKGQISAEQQNESDILAIRAKAGSVREAVDLVNTTAEVYIKQSSEEKDKRIDETVRFIRSQLEQTSQDLKLAEKALGDFKRNNAVTLAMSPTQGVDLQEKQFQLQQKLQETRAALASLTRIQQSKDYDSLQNSDIQVDDPLMSGLINELTKQASVVTELRNKRVDLLKFQTSVSPQVVNISSQLAAEERKLVVQLSTLVRRLSRIVSEYERINSTVSRQQSEFLRQPEVLGQLDSLQAMFKEKSELATALRKQSQDAEIQQRSRIQELALVERADGARGVAQPSVYYKSLIGVLIGFFLGGVLAFVLESLDTSIGTIEDVERYINSVVLGVVPHIEVGDVKSRVKLVDFSPDTTEEDLHRFSRLTTHFDPKSVASEAYRTMRTNVGSVMAKSNAKLVMVTSSVLQEGKTTSATNLATAFAQTGRRTLLIDGDLRRPHIDKIFGVEKLPGLSDILLGTRDLKECLRTIDDFILGKFGLKMARITPGLEYLNVLTAGRTSENPAELLNSTATDKLLAEVKEKFDVVIIDVSPILPVADASILAPKVDGVILSYQIGRVGRDVLKRSKMRLETLGGRIWGIIMNDIQAEIDYRRGDYQYYTYKYEPGPAPPPSLLERVKSRFRAAPAPTKDVPGAPPTRPPAAPEVMQRPPAPPPPPPRNDQELRDIMGLTDDE
jgi:capsular exopolysaccharide synthesis family protein